MDRLQAALLSYGLDAGLIIGVAEEDPDFAAAQALAGAMHLFRMTHAGREAARPFITRAEAGARGATVREQMLVSAIAAWHGGRVRQALAQHRALAARFPRDLVSARIAQFHLINLGDFRALRSLTAALLEANSDVPQVKGMHAFALEQTGEHAAGEVLGREAAEAAFDPWAEHAVAHALDSRAAHAEAIAWLSPRHARWRDLSSFLRTHNFWHLALAHLASGDAGAALGLWDAEVWGVRPDHVQDQINAISLLIRLERAGLGAEDRWQRLAPYLAANGPGGINAFADLHHAYGLARADAAPALEALLETLEADANRPNPPVLAVAIARAAQALVCHARGRFTDAALGLAEALPALRQAGGSSMQQQLFALLLADAMDRSRRAA
jgi:hypothetical protein